MKKILIIPMIVLTFLSITSASDGDCHISINTVNAKLSGRNENNDDEIIQNLAKTLPKEAIEKAINNLNSYCCEISEDCTPNSEDSYPESIYLFDHILDVYLRRLDAKGEDDNGKDLLYGLNPDEKGKEWRDFITEIGNDINGSLPLQINDKYNSIWKQQKSIMPFSKSTNESINERKYNLTGNILDYENWTLGDKYNLACDISMYISEGILKQANRLETSYYDACKELTDNRINNEFVYTKSILMQKANILLKGNMNSYLSTYFVSNKMSELQQKIFDISTTFFEINRNIPKLIPNCSS